ncbi:MAG: hypothetical protein ACR2MG_02685 [Pyrinomonadaceae bacterium]
MPALSAKREQKQLADDKAASRLNNCLMLTAALLFHVALATYCGQDARAPIA